MEKASGFQKQLFQMISNKLPRHLSLVDEISDRLNISMDSSYRRIRGDKVLSLDEAIILSVHFNISLDNLLGTLSDSVTFQMFHLDEERFNFKNYLESLLIQMKNVMHSDKVELIFQLNELNLFHAVQFPNILAFKIYFWSKSNLDFKGFRDKKFSLSDIDEEIYKLSSTVAGMYTKFKTTELLSREFLVSFLKQIEYYWLSGFFERSEDAVSLCDSALELIEHLRKQAELGFKFIPGSEPYGEDGNLRFFSNDLTLADNVILVNMGGQGLTYLTNGAINLLMTNNQDFFRSNLSMVQTILRKSTLISGNAERDRNHFFNMIRDNVIQTRNRIGS